MIIENLVYELLSADATLESLCTIYPIAPKLNAVKPHLTYKVGEPENTITTNDGPSNLWHYAITLEAVAKDAQVMLEIMQRVRTILHGYRGGSVQLCRKTGQDRSGEDEGYVGTDSYKISVNEDGNNIDPVILVTRGSDRLITLRRLLDSLTGQYVNTATVTGILYESDEVTEVYSFSMPYVASSNGTYRGEIPDTTTSTLDVADYRLKVTANAGAADEVFWSTVRVTD